MQTLVIVHFPGLAPDGSAQQALDLSLTNVDTYRKLGAQGLRSKHYYYGPSGGGGVYLWESKEAAQAWYTDTLLERLTKTFGVAPTLSWFDNFLTVDNVAGSVHIGAGLQGQIP